MGEFRGGLPQCAARPAEQELGLLEVRVAEPPFGCFGLALADNGHLALDPRQRLPQPVEAATEVLRDDAVDLDVQDVAQGVFEVQPHKF